MDFSHKQARRGSTGRMIVFPLAESGQRLVFSPTVLEHFEEHQQLRWWHREAGGQVFAQLALPDIIVVEATGPRPLDWRTRHTYRPSRSLEQREIVDRHARGLHFIGDWHTHPEVAPTPSRRDMLSMQELVTNSTHALNGFVLIIVGTCLLYTSPSPRDKRQSRMPSSA